MPTSEFREIAHCGGYVRIHATQVDGKQQASMQVGGSAPNPMAWAGLYVNESGDPVAIARLGGIGVPFDPPPGALPFPVMFGSDSQGRFGHLCAACKLYWRGEHPSEEVVCPYCGTLLEGHLTLTAAQRRYAKLFVEMLHDALASLTDGTEVDREMSFDALADAAESGLPRPSFYYTEESQQHQFTCSLCGAFNDVMGHAVYCSICGGRNDEQIFREAVTAIRGRLHSNALPADALRDTVSLFDGSAKLLIQQLTRRIPMRPRTRARLERANHQLIELSEALDKAFEIELLEGLKPAEIALARRFFWRRHVHEHNAGIVDQEYIERSEDTTVRLGQHLRESKADVQALTEIVSRMLSNLSKAFAEIFPPRPEPISDFERRQAFMRPTSSPRR